MPNDTIPLPGPWDYCYEWDGPFGTRKFSAASYNGNRPDRSVPIYTADQMHAHAAAVTAADNAQLRERLDVLEDALNKIASWREGRIVNSWFDEPFAAEIARAALGDKT